MESSNQSLNLKSFMSRRMLHVVLPLFLVSIIACLDRVNISYAAMTMKQDLDWLTPEVFGYGASIFFVGYVLFELPASIIASKFNAMKWIARIMFSWGIVCLLMTQLSTTFEFYLFRFLLGLCEASLYPVIYSLLIPNWFTPKERPKAISYMLTSLLVAQIIGAPLAGELLELSPMGLHGWQSLFLLEGIPAIIFAIIFAFWMKAYPRQAKWVTAEEVDYIEKELKEEEEHKQKVKKYSITKALADPTVLKLCLIYFLWVVGFWGFNFWMPQVLKALSGWSPALVGWSIVIPTAAALIIQVICGRSATKTGEKRWHIALPLFIGACGLAATPFMADPLLALVCICLSSVGVYGGMGVWWTVPTSFLSGAAAAGAMSLINSCGNLGGLVGPAMMGKIKALTGSTDLGFYIMGAAMLLAGLLVLTLPKEKTKAHK